MSINKVAYRFGGKHHHQYSSNNGNRHNFDIVDQTYYISIEDFDYFLPQYVLYQLYLQDIQSVIIEGGVKTLQSFIDANLWDEARIFTSDATWGNGLKAPIIKGEITERIKIENDQLSILKPSND